MADEVSERKRLSIPKVDVSVLEWWEAQYDVGASVSQLIRAEIERNGITDVVYRPVIQQPRRGRPPGPASESIETTEDETPRAAAPAPIPEPVAEPQPSTHREPELVDAMGMSPIDAIMNG